MSIATPATAESAAGASANGALANGALANGMLDRLARQRAALEDRGLKVSLGYTAETFGVIRGGIKRGAVFEGNLDLQLDVDLGKMLGWTGLAFHAQGYRIHGKGPTRRLLGNLMTGSGIEALPSTRLVELWLEQSLFDDRLALRVGQLAADSEFIVSDTAGLFVNGTFGGPASTSANLPAGWIAYPWAAPAVRVKVSPAKDLTLLAAVFNGDPSGGGTGEPLRHNDHGVRFPLHNAPLFMAEMAYAFNAATGGNALPGVLKLGAWYHAGRFDDRRYDADGRSLADPAGTGIARRRRSNPGFYLVADQMVWRSPDGGGREVSAFLRASASPGDRNLVSLYGDMGVTCKGLFAGRPDDVAGVAFAYARISDRARALDRDANGFGAATPIRSSEALVEIAYQAQIRAGWTIQPNLQYVIRPGGRVSRPDAADRTIRNAVMLGLRTTLTY